MLDLCHDVLRLDAFDFANAHLRSEERILTERVVSTAKFKITVDVYERLEGDVDAEGAVFPADDEAVLIGVLDAEGGGDAHGGGFRLGGVASEHAGRSVGKTQAGYAQARDTGEVAGLTLIDAWVFLCAVDEGQFLSEGHLAQKLVDTRISGNDGNGLCGGACRGERKQHACKKNARRVTKKPCVNVRSCLIHLFPLTPNGI